MEMSEIILNGSEEICICDNKIVNVYGRIRSNISGIEMINVCTECGLRKVKFENE